MESAHKIIIIGTNHHNTLSMVRSFGEEGEMVILYIYGDNKSFIASSIYVKEVYYFNSANDAINSVIAFSNNEGIKPVVISCSDEVSSLMDIRYDELISKCYFFNAGESGKVTYYMDKQKQLDLAKECGFSIPTSLEFCPKDVDFNVVKFPCIVKPKESIHGGKKIAICNDIKELQKALLMYNPQYDVLIQDYILKEAEIVIVGLSIAENIIIPGFILKHREENGGTTFSSVRPIYELDSNIIDASRLLIKKIHYKGLWGIECIRHGDNYFFLELNMRNDATTYAMKTAGVNLPYLYFLTTRHKMIEVSDIRTIYSIVEFNDFNFVLKGRISLCKWLKDYKSSECKYYYSDKDRMPYIIKRREYIKFLCKRILK